ncbi:MAG: (2Fe-2S)-binding protein [Bdellovibrionaceae bacterium]|nr:(2Fe-2S)-binding protein [Pseudobdellovibrionaceae bacterium]
MIMRRGFLADKFLVKVVAEIPYQDRIEGEKTDAGWRLKAVGCARLLAEVRALAAISNDPSTWALPETTDHVGLLLREFILKTQGAWAYPYADEELCHCRNVPTAVVDRAIMNGAHTGPQVSRLTNASTSCGTCRPDVECIIKYRKTGCLAAAKKAA